MSNQGGKQYIHGIYWQYIHCIYWQYIRCIYLTNIQILSEKTRSQRDSGVGYTDSIYCCIFLVQYIGGIEFYTTNIQRVYTTYIPLYNEYTENPSICGMSKWYISSIQRYIQRIYQYNGIYIVYTIILPVYTSYIPPPKRAITGFCTYFLEQNFS